MSGCPSFQSELKSGGLRRQREVAGRRAGGHPVVQGLDLGVGEARILDELAVLRVGEPRRHGALGRDLADRLRPGAGLVVGQERHRRGLPGPMAARAVLVEDGRYVVGPGHRRGVRRVVGGRRGEGGGREERQGEDEEGEAGLHGLLLGWAGVRGRGDSSGKQPETGAPRRMPARTPAHPVCGVGVQGAGAPGVRRRRELHTGCADVPVGFLKRTREAEGLAPLRRRCTRLAGYELQSNAERTSSSIRCQASGRLPMPQRTISSAPASTYWCSRS